MAGFGRRARRRHLQRAGMNGTPANGAAEHNDVNGQEELGQAVASSHDGASTVLSHAEGDREEEVGSKVPMPEQAGHGERATPKGAASRLHESAVDVAASSAEGEASSSAKPPRSGSRHADSGGHLWHGQKVMGPSRSLSMHVAHTMPGGSLLVVWRHHHPPQNGHNSLWVIRWRLCAGIHGCSVLVYEIVKTK